MSTLITSVEHALAAAAQDVVKAAKFVETSVLPVLKKAQAEAPTIEAVTALVSLQAAKAGVVVNDNIARFNGTVAILPAVIDEKERVVITVMA